ncbi:MAG: hypothetical protein ABWY22_04160 [Flavobacterium sp.]
MTTEIIIGGVGLIIAIATFIQSQKPQEIKLPEPKEEIENLKVHFLMNQKLSEEIQEILENYIVENNASEKLLFENMSFSKYLNFVREEHESGLSEKAYKMISQQLTRPIIESMLSSLQNQNNSLMMVKNTLKTL